VSTVEPLVPDLLSAMTAAERSGDVCAQLAACAVAENAHRFPAESVMNIAYNWALVAYAARMERNQLWREWCSQRRAEDTAVARPWPTADITCDTCGAPETAWDVTHPLHLEGSHQCPLCREADCAEEAKYKRRTDL
jgi:hypothetical protein